jgi:hypothetical protein
LIFSNILSITTNEKNNLKTNQDPVMW